MDTISTGGRSDWSENPEDGCAMAGGNLFIVSSGFFDNSKPMVVQFAELAKLAQLVQMAQ